MHQNQLHLPRLLFLKFTNHISSRFLYLPISIINTTYILTKNIKSKHRLSMFAFVNGFTRIKLF